MNFFLLFYRKMYWETTVYLIEFWIYHFTPDRNSFCCTSFFAVCWNNYIDYINVLEHYRELLTCINRAFTLSCLILSINCCSPSNTQNKNWFIRVEVTYITSLLHLIESLSPRSKYFSGRERQIKLIYQGPSNLHTPTHISYYTPPLLAFHSFHIYVT